MVIHLPPEFPYSFAIYLNRTIIACAAVRELSKVSRGWREDMFVNAQSWSGVFALQEKIYKPLPGCYLWLLGWATVYEPVSSSTSHHREFQVSSGQIRTASLIILMYFYPYVLICKIKSERGPDIKSSKSNKLRTILIEMCF